MMFWPLTSHSRPNKAMDPPYGPFAVSQRITGVNVLNYWENFYSGFLTMEDGQLY